MQYAPWDYRRNGLTQSFINKFLECRTQCYKEYVEGWTAKEEPMWFNFGHHVHFVFENVYTNYRAPTYQEIEYLLKRYQQIRFGDQVITGEKYKENQAIYEVARALLKIYFFHYQKEYKRSWLHTEKVFKTPFEDTFLTGKFDGVFEDEDEELWLIDHKCLSYIDESAITAALPYDMQINIYLYAANEIFGRFPKGLIYNILRRPGEKIGAKETTEDFSNRIMFKVLEQPDYYFIRIPLKRDPIELKEWKEYQLKPIVNEIRRWATNEYKDTYVNPNALISKYGRAATFGLITTGSTLGLKKKTSVFPELEV